MSERPHAAPSADDMALRLAIRVLLDGFKPRKARAQLKDAAELLRIMLPRELPANVQWLRPVPAEALARYDAARRILAAVKAELEWRA